VGSLQAKQRIALSGGPAKGLHLQGALAGC